MSVAPAMNVRIGGKVESMPVEALSLDLGEGADWADSTSDTFAMEHPSTSSSSPSWIRDGFALKKYRQAGEGEDEVGEESFDVFGASTSFEESAVSMSWMVAASPTRDSYTSREESTSSFEEGSAVAKAMAGALARAVPAPASASALRIEDSFLVAWQAACAARGLSTAEDEFRMAGTVAEVLQGCLRLVTSAFSHGVEPKLTDSVSTGGSYFLEDLAGHSVGVFKPEDEEPYAVNNPKSHPGQAVPWQGKGVPGIKAGVNVGEGAAREVAAYLLDHHAFASVPPSVLISGSHPTFHVAKRSPCGSPTTSALPEKVGSFQLFVPHFASAEDLGSSLFPVEEVHRIGVLDVRLFNTDRNSDNVLVCPTFPAQQEQQHGDEGGSLGSYSSGSPAITFGRPRGGVDSEDDEDEEVITANSVVQHWAAYVEEAGEVQEHAEFGSAAGTVPDSVIMKARSVSVGMHDRNQELSEASASLLLSDSLSPSPSPSPEPEEGEVGPGAGGGVSSPQACRSGKGSTFTRLAHPPRMRPMHISSSSSRRRGIATGRGRGRGRGSVQRLGSEDEDDHDSIAARPRLPGSLFLSADQPGGAELWRLGERGEQQAPASSSSVPMTVGGWSSPTTLATVAAAGPQGSTSSSSSARPFASPARPRGKPLQRGKGSGSSSKAGSRRAAGGGSRRRRRSSLKMGSLGSPSLCHSARASESGSFDPRELRRATDIKLVPIDHGLCLPHIACLDEAEFGWLYWRQAKKPFTPQVLAYIAELDGEADAELLRRALGHRVREGCLATLRVCTLLLQLAAARGLTLHQIGRIMVRTRYGSPSLLERALAGARGKAVEAAAGEVSLLAGEDGDDRERYDLLMRVVPPFLEQAIECAVSGEEGEECGMPMYNRCRSTTL